MKELSGWASRRSRSKPTKTTVLRWLRKIRNASLNKTHVNLVISLVVTSLVLRKRPAGEKLHTSRRQNKAKRVRSLGQLYPMTK